MAYSSSSAAYAAAVKQLDPIPHMTYSDRDAAYAAAAKEVEYAQRPRTPRGTHIGSSTWGRPAQSVDSRGKVMILGDEDLVGDATSDIVRFTEVESTMSDRGAFSTRSTVQSDYQASARSYYQGSSTRVAGFENRSTTKHQTVDAFSEAWEGSDNPTGTQSQIHYLRGETVAETLERTGDHFRYEDAIERAHLSRRLSGVERQRDYALEALVLQQGIAEDLERELTRSRKEIAVLQRREAAADTAATDITKQTGYQDNRSGQSAPVSLKVKIDDDGRVELRRLTEEQAAASRRRQRQGEDGESEKRDLKAARVRGPNYRLSSGSETEDFAEFKFIYRRLGKDVDAQQASTNQTRAPGAISPRLAQLPDSAPLDVEVEDDTSEDSPLRAPESKYERALREWVESFFSRIGVQRAEMLSSVLGKLDQIGYDEIFKIFPAVLPKSIEQHLESRAQRILEDLQEKPELNRPADQLEAFRPPDLFYRDLLLDLDSVIEEQRQRLSKWESLDTLDEDRPLETAYIARREADKETNERDPIPMDVDGG